VPVGTTGSADVFDVAHDSFARVDGFRTLDKEMHGKKRTMGPSAAAVGEGVVYIGNRASNEVCPIDTKSLKPGRCLQLSSATDGVAYVASVKEVWVTTPKDQTVTILDASKPESLKAKTTIKTDGAPEGYAIDDARGLFFTNLEDKGGTLAIDVRTHKIKAAWNAGCSADGPRGVALDAVHDFVVVACTDHLQILDAAHDGAKLGTLDTGAGVDNIDVVGATVYAAAGKAARLTVATIDDSGKFAIVATGDTAEGARNAVADEHGNVFVADSQGARLFVFAPATTR
jgi:DNA-binding beta-propeller fold protein YncE